MSLNPGPIMSNLEIHGTSFIFEQMLKMFQGFKPILAHIIHYWNNATLLQALQNKLTHFIIFSIFKTTSEDNIAREKKRVTESSCKKSFTCFVDVNIFLLYMGPNFIEILYRILFIYGTKYDVLNDADDIYICNNIDGVP